MEYAKDVILNVNYGQTVKEKYSIFGRIGKLVVKHKMITTIISITVMMIILDFMLISSFVKILCNI